MTCSRNNISSIGQQATHVDESYRSLWDPAWQQVRHLAIDLQRENHKVCLASGDRDNSNRDDCSTSEAGRGCDTRKQF